MEELNLCWCASIDARSLAAIVPRASSLRSLGLRGTSLTGVLEAALAALARTPPRLEAIDMAFCSGLQSQTVLQLATGCPLLKRCNLRAAIDCCPRGMLLRPRSAAALLALLLLLGDW